VFNLGVVGLSEASICRLFHDGGAPQHLIRSSYLTFGFLAFPGPMASVGAFVASLEQV
jgi:hypothetical protein